MADSQAPSVFIPLLFLVVIELSSLAREIDLTETAEKDHAPFILGFWPLPAFPQALKIPSFGRFNFIHATNFALLSLGMLITSPPSGNVSGALALVVWLGWILLPVFEVDEYDDILTKGRRPWSFLIHAFLSTLTATFVLLSPAFIEFLATNNFPVFSEDPEDWALYVYFMLALIANQQFLIQLSKEMPKYDSDSN